MQTIGLFYNQRKDQAIQVAHEISSWLKKQGHAIYEISSETECDHIPQLHFAISVGGDGSLIMLASLLKELSIPVLGINAGSLGFLTNVKREEMIDELTRVLKGEFTIEERLMLHATIQRSDTKTEEFVVLNDIVVSREGLTRFLEINVRVNNNIVTQFGGDGIIVATPTGSTAYSLSAGGPFLYPTLKEIVITPLCAHALRVRPCVVPTDEAISISAQCEHESELASVIFDGHHKRQLGLHDKITIKKAPYVFRLIVSSVRDYYDIINEKF